MLRRYANTTQTLTKLRVAFVVQGNMHKLSVEYARGSGSYALRSQKYKLSQPQKRRALGSNVLVPLKGRETIASAQRNAL